MRLVHPFPDRAIWSVSDLEALPDDGNRYEILHGELFVTPTPELRHQGVAANLVVLLASFCRANTDWLVCSFGCVYMSETSWLEPDVAVYAEPSQSKRTWRDVTAPLLVVEILSASTRARDRFRKRPAYLEHGVREVWLINTDARTVERWFAGRDFPEPILDSFSWHPDTKYAALSITAADVFGAAM
jgi:Uma2 family endonuclease